MDTRELNDAMWEATRDLLPAADFVGRVVHGGRSRARRARLRAVALATAALGLVGGTAVAVLHDATADQYVGPDSLLSAATRGDLATNTVVLAYAAKAWDDGVRYLDDARHVENPERPTGAHVYWAGTTPSGIAAVIAQPAPLEPDEDPATIGRDRSPVLLGLVAADALATDFQMVGAHYLAAAAVRSCGFAFGPDDRTVLVLDAGEPLYYSAPTRTDLDGIITRDWQRMALTDGVAVAQAPAGADGDDVQVLARQARPSSTDQDPAGMVHLRRASA